MYFTVIHSTLIISSFAFISNLLSRNNSFDMRNLFKKFEGTVVYSKYSFAVRESEVLILALPLTSCGLGISDLASLSLCGLIFKLRMIMLVIQSGCKINSIMVFIEPLPCARHCSRFYGYSDELELAFKELVFKRESQANH